MEGGRERGRGKGRGRGRGRERERRGEERECLSLVQGIEISGKAGVKAGSGRSNGISIFTIIRMEREVLKINSRWIVHVHVGICTCTQCICRYYSGL